MSELKRAEQLIVQRTRAYQATLDAIERARVAGKPVATQVLRQLETTGDALQRAWEQRADLLALVYEGQ